MSEKRAHKRNRPRLHLVENISACADGAYSDVDTARSIVIWTTHRTTEKSTI